MESKLKILAHHDFLKSSINNLQVIIKIYNLFLILYFSSTFHCLLIYYVINYCAVSSLIIEWKFKVSLHVLIDTSFLRHEKGEGSYSF